MTQKELENEMTNPRPRRLFAILEALRRSWKTDTISKLSNIDEISVMEFQNSDIVRNPIVSKILEVFPEK